MCHFLLLHLIYGLLGLDFFACVDSMSFMDDVTMFDLFELIFIR